ncbi:uncharacterized protein N7496_005220 [Penicillium cataractarum]|uniref:Uncharacterized protein n=1 Tax=Penicillium cataractarum TaxID=2100454 RepID=A0A9W9SFR1_9EURO|nr:uncharacterized protein N7496_005220 [Penicillium cataractarum]KAJ5377811.1 hypothetical protein N7496_005220 [Penicillium cataractarum]
MFQSPLDSTSREEVFLVQDIEAQDLDTRTLELTQDVGDLKLTVTVSRFTPRDTDKTALAWTDEQGQEHSFEMAPYCLNNVKQDVLNMRNYAFEARGPYIDSILANANDITRKFVAAAQQYISTKKNTLLEQAIELWTTTRLTERVWRICGNETLGMDPISDKTCPDFGIIPVTPIMDTQLDQIVIREILLPLRNRILYKLDGRLKEPKRDEWFENFLIIFILLSSIEACSVHGEKFAKEFGLRRRYADMEEFNSYFHSCRILLAHFHIALNGSTPLTIDWLSPKADKLAVLTLEQKRFLEAAKPMIAEEGM